MLQVPRIGPGPKHRRADDPGRDPGVIHHHTVIPDAHRAIRNPGCRKCVECFPPYGVWWNALAPSRPTRLETESPNLVVHLVAAGPCPQANVTGTPDRSSCHRRKSKARSAQEIRSAAVSLRSIPASRAGRAQAYLLLKMFHRRYPKRPAHARLSIRRLRSGRGIA